MACVSEGGGVNARSRMCAAKIRMDVTTAKAIDIGTTVRGCGIPAAGSIKLMATITAMSKARLRPTEYARHSIQPVLCMRSILSNNMPGMKVIKMKPQTWVSTGTLMPMQEKAANMPAPIEKTSEKTNSRLNCQSLGGIILCIFTNLPET